MRVLTWNVRGLHNLRLQLQASMSSLLESLRAGAIDPLDYLGYDRTQGARALTDVSADIICFQETQLGQRDYRILRELTDVSGW